ncbi:hypothetical protein [uncultured Zhongshania sp.]|uniref:hypothetical protein n=1 Tax=uncultured Zhongshania sp. TaxID=1642288 RepID=UPI0025DD0D27|nr:hypothetical protein [uncultured Zhongshania sp.]
MSLKHRSIYYSDVGLFVLLATPILNDFVINFLLSFGNSDFYTGLSRSAVVSFVGIAGVLGLGISILRLKIADSRDVVLISLLVKIAAACWLLYAYSQGISDAFLILAIADIYAAIMFGIALIRRT